MKYLLIMQVNPAVVESLTKDEQNALMTGHHDFLAMVRESGELVDTLALGDPSSSAVVRPRNGMPAVTDGPFVESKEFMGGYYLVDVENRERALELAKRIPDASIEGLAIEVRPVMYEPLQDL